MELKYSLSMLFTNINLAFKLMVWLIISLLFSLIIGYVIINPIWDKLALISNINQIVDNFVLIKNNLFYDGYSFKVLLPEIINNIKALILEIGNYPSFACGLIFELIFVNMLLAFLFGLSFVPSADIMDKFMTSNLRFGFASSLTLNIKKSMQYSFERLIISLPINFATFVIILSTLLGLYNIIGGITIAIVLIFALLLVASKNTLLAGWLPRLIYHSEEKLFSSFSRSLISVKNNLICYFKSFVLLALIDYLAISAFAEATFGMIVFIIVPMYFITLRTTELIGYFKQKHFSFYVDSINVINTVEYGLRNDNQDCNKGE